MADDNTQQQPPPPQYDLQSLLGQMPQIPQAPQPDQTPVSQGWLSKLGEVLGGGMPSAMAAMSPADRNMAGLNALTDFSAGLMRASGNIHPGQTWMSNVGEALGGAQRGYLGSEGLSASMLGAKQEYAEQQYKDQLERLKTVLPLLKLQAGANIPNTLLSGPPASGGAPSGSIAAAIAPFVAPNLPKDITPAEDQMVRTVYGEARGEPVVGQQGVASVIKNRMTAGNQSAQDVIFTPNAFQPWNDPKTRQMLEKLDPADPQYQAILNKAVRPVMAGDAKDPTGGATNFYSPTALDALKLPIPSWAANQKPSAVIGGHQFYNLPYGAPRTAAGGPPAGGAPVAPAAVPAVPVARPGGAPVAPPGTIQGVPGDTGGGAQVAGPGAQAGRIAPPGPAVPGDVNAIIAGMKGAGAAPATLAPGAATAGPTAPASTVVAANQPAPQLSTQQDQPPAVTPPGGKLTFEQFQAQHPIAVDPSTYTVTTPDLTQAKAAQAEAARQLSLARAGISGDPNKSLSDYNTATKAVSDAQAAADAKTAELRVAAQKNVLDTQRELYKDEMTRQQQVEEADKQRTAAAAIETQKGQQAIDLAKVTAGQTWHQKLQEQAAADAQENTIKPMAAASMKAHQMNLGLSQMLPVLQDLPPGGGPLGVVLDAHPDLAPLFNSAGILNDKQADAVGLINGLVSSISTEMKPQGLGALREYEWDAFKAQLPSMLRTTTGQQKRWRCS